MKVKISPYYDNGRRVSVEVEQHDTFSIDSTLSYIVLPLLIQLRQTKMGVPAEFAEVGGEDYIPQLCFDFYTETQEDAFKLGTERWNLILDKMIWSWQQLALEDYENQYYHGTLGWIDINKNTKIDKDFWVDYIGLELHNERIQEGLELFGKYMRHLWD
jgi:hypothetical protein